MSDYDFIATGIRPFDPTVSAHMGALTRQSQQETANAREQQKIIQQQQTENDLKLKAAARADRDMGIVNDALQQHMQTAEPGTLPDYKSIVGTVAKNGASAGTVMGLHKSLINLHEETNKMDAEQLKALNARHEILGGKFEAMLALPNQEARAQAYPQVIQESLQDGSLTPQEAKGLSAQYPGDAQFNMKRNLLFLQGGMAKQAALKQETALKEAEAQKNVAQALEAGAKTEETKGKTAEAQRMQAAPVLAEALKNGGPEAYQAALDAMPRGLAKHFEYAQKPEDILAIGMTPEAQVKDATEKMKAQWTKEYQQGELGLQKQRVALEGQSVALKAKQDAREEKIYEQTYGSGANPALVGVEPKLRTQAASAAAKVIAEYETGKKSADDIQSVLDLTKAGNKAGAANVPLVGVGALNAINGIKRMNKAEIDQYGGAGSLLDKIQGKLGGWVSGQPIPPDVLKDMEQLHQTLRGNLEKAANDKLGGVNQTYRSDFKLPKSTASTKVRMQAPDGTTSEVDPSQVDHYKSKGAKVIQ